MFYFGDFYKMKNQYKDEIEYLDFYDNIAADFYHNFTNKCVDPVEMLVYSKNSEICGKSILELACGSGRITLELAKLGLNVIGIDKSDRLLQHLGEEIKIKQNEILGNIKVYNKDLFELDFEYDFNMVILPATSISLLADDMDKLNSLFNTIYNKLPNKGRFIFDYKVDLNNQNYKTEPNKFKININGQSVDVVMQEFNDFKNRISTLNVFLEVKEETQSKKYLTYTNRRIFDFNTIYKLIDSTKFKIVEEIDKNIGINQYIRFVVLEK